MPKSRAKPTKSKRKAAPDAAAPRALTHKEARFIDRLLVHGNRARAAREAGYAEEHDRFIGYQLLTKLHIREEYERRTAELARAAEVEAHIVLQELRTVALSDVADLFDVAGRLLPVREIPEETRRAIASVKVRVERAQQVEVADVIEVKLWPKLDALTKLGQTRGMFVERKELSGPGGAPLPAPVFYMPDNGRDAKGAA